jgi:hypothetical protein
LYCTYLFIYFFSVETVKKTTAKKAEKGRVVTQLECRAHLELLFENEREIIDVLFGEKIKGEGSPLFLY